MNRLSLTLRGNTFCVIKTDTDPFLNLRNTHGLKRDRTPDNRACLKNRKRRLFALKRSSFISKSLVKRRFDCVFSLKLTSWSQKSVISSIFKQELIQ